MKDETLRKLAANPNYTFSEEQQKAYNEMMAREDTNRKRVVSHNTDFKVNTGVVNKHSQELEDEWKS